MGIILHTEEELLDRLRHIVRTQQPAVFLVGAPISAPLSSGGKGVPGVQQMIDLMANELGSNAESRAALLEKWGAHTTGRYSNAFESYIARRGQDAANRLVKRAVLSARVNSLEDDCSEARAEQLEKELDGWFLPPGLNALCQLITMEPATFGRTVLTSNFDPLIEIGITRHDGRHYSTVLHRDGNLNQTVAAGCHVVHFHGFWRGYDTLHTTRQLQQNRPRLASSLGDLIKNRMLIVLAYGGWDDIFTRAIMEVVANDNANPDIAWAFYSNDESTVQTQNAALLNNLAPAFDRGRLTLFGGIDCNIFLPKLVEECRLALQGSSIKIGPGVTSRVTEEIDKIEGKRLEIHIKVSERRLSAGLTDNPPQFDVWVGRGDELLLLERGDYQVAVITGIGGQGKSTLAANHMARVMEAGPNVQCDWRDCREQGDRLHTQLVSIIERLTDGAVSPSTLHEADIDTIIELFFLHLSQREYLFIFDNIDHYIDLEMLSPLGEMAKLFDTALKRRHSSRFVFTCRPAVRHESDRFINIHLSGLSLSEVEELFCKRGIPEPSPGLLSETYKLTDGHPLWTNLIALQAGRVSGGLRQVLDDIRHERGTLPQTTLRSIWNTLNDNQRSVLRTIAELEVPEPEGQLGEIIKDMNWNRLARSLRTLKSLNLVVVKRDASGPDLVELHPMIREFIRMEYPKKERERYIASILNFLDRMIGRYKSILPQTPSLQILENWTHKVELELNRGNYDAALTTLSEVSGPLVNRGFPQEFLRVARRTLRLIDWSHACVSSKDFDPVLSAFVKVLVEFGTERDADDMLEKYEASIPGKSSQYIHLCDLRTYAFWYRGEFDKAIFWGECGETLLKQSNVDTKWSTAHNLALARRDMGRVEESLTYFLAGVSLADVIRGAVEKEEAQYFGNIGRCLFLAGRLEESETCYRKSAALLSRASDSHAQLNRGYIRDWMAQLWEDQGRLVESYAACRAAEFVWQAISPPRSASSAANANRILAALPNAPRLPLVEAWRFESMFSAWVSTGKTDTSILDD